MQARRYTIQAFVFVVLLVAGLLENHRADAHPHVWVTMETDFLYNTSKQITGFRHKWTFDEAYTSFAVQGLDKDGDGILSRDELAELAQVNITSLKEFEYFTFPKVGNAVVERLEPRDYYLEHHDGRLTLYLTIPLVTPIPLEQQRDFHLVIYDPTLFVDFAFAKDNPVKLSGAPTTCAATIKNPASQATSVQSLGEAFFNNTSAAADLAARYAKTVTVSCAGS
jgi:ABC-type uncharacterized transport system substrate-binding protein